VVARLIVFAAVALATTLFLHTGSPLAQAPEAPKNLKVLPKDMSRRQVIEIMRSFSSSLGVKCIECHVSTKPGSEHPDDMDFASDQKADKETARKMMRMVNSINEQIGQMGLKDPVQVRCVTCHHGVKVPQTLAAVLTKTANEKGADATVESYRKLRERYHGTGAYNFSPAALNEVAGQLAQSKKDFDGAIKLLNLNLEFAPKDSETWTLLGQAQFQKGDKAAATASLEKALQLDPENRHAKQVLERVKGGQ
jgi:Flp pilus assembly protein TadD